ncbi:MAG: LysR family transcriptional regulator [Variovorax sp. 67-131]|jgi:LysR family transcriptional regulator, carnitine catabolism transcriptional activator|nr:LysR family transcriptional regulator [Variovorax sp.]ODU18968.1 MAG: LysR family transcriptional regulator [Variovorax sp. SCN 67-85]ODV23619.1 MAG: LysR family transcriptional regulator [Variovorax sp. SCN 67-20]OJZ08233.1 MAG: LysR family transcriptional regulator [Variovorax sp. 67-131]
MNPSVAIHKQPLSSLPSVRQLRAFVAIYHTGSISAAAQELALTQPAVTMLLRELETKLGMSLFDRHTRALHRTDAATRAIGFAQRALAEMEGLSTSMSELAGLHAGRVRVVATAAVAQAMLPPAMRRFLEKHPEVSLEIEEVGPADFVNAIDNSQVDFGVGTLEAPVAGLREEVLVRETLVAAALRSPTFTGGVPMTWKQLSALPLVTVRSGYGIRGRIDAAAREAGVQLRIAHEVSLLSTAVALAANGLGVVVLPPSIVAHETKLVTQRLMRPTIERVIGVHLHKERSLSPAAKAFLQVLRHTVAEN